MLAHLRGRSQTLRSARRALLLSAEPVLQVLEEVLMGKRVEVSIMEVSYWRGYAHRL